MSDQEQEKLPKEQQFVQFPMLAFDDLPDFCAAEIKILLYVRRHTKGYGENRRILSTDELEHGRKRKDGSRMDRGTGLSNRAIIDAIRKLEQKKYLFPAKETGGQKSYAVTDCPPLTDYAPVKKVHRQQKQEDVQESSSMKKVHSIYEESSQEAMRSVHSPSEQSSQEAADGARPQAARRDAIDTLEDTSFIDTLIDTIPPSASLQAGAHKFAPSVVENEKEQEAENVGIQNRLLTLKKEKEAQEAILQSNPGNGAATARLREIKTNIADLQAQLGASAAPGEGIEDVPPTAELEKATKEYNEIQQDIADMEEELGIIDEMLAGELDTFTRRAKGIRKRTLERDKLPPARERLTALAKFLNIPESA